MSSIEKEIDEVVDQENNAEATGQSNNEETDSLASLSSSSVEGFEIVEMEQVKEPTVEAEFIATCKKYNALLNNFQQRQLLFYQHRRYAMDHFSRFLANHNDYQSMKLRQSGDWTLTETDRNDSLMIRLFDKARKLFRDDQETADVFYMFIDKIVPEESVELSEEEVYAVEQHLFDFSLIKKSLSLLRDVLATNTTRKFTELNRTAKEDCRPPLFGVLDHLKRWFQHLLQRFNWFLELKYEKLPKCSRCTRLTDTLKEIPSVSNEFHWLIDDFLSNFKTAFNFCERFGQKDIVYYFYESLINISLRNEMLFEQFLWARNAINEKILDERLSLMEHQARVLEKIICMNPLRFVQETANPEAAYCAYLWLKSDMCIQHFRCSLEARNKGFKVSTVDEDREWLQWSITEDLALGKMPKNEDGTSWKSENWLLEYSQIRMTNLEALTDELASTEQKKCENQMISLDLSVD
ncbi:hypothetical protein M3Y97_00993600 [Aphelenchoides bicaudatus]|nr:hypothetical protein M3Y97_00993600 [Aphelenchoides bicaudatus]